MDAAPSCVAYRVRKLSRVITALYDEQFAPLSLKISQFGILGMIFSHGPMAVSDLCKMLSMDKSTASRNLQRMRRKRWISVVRSKDGRGQDVSLTGQGLRLLRAAYPRWQKAQEEATRRLGASGVGALADLLENAQR